jgi:hypothetical protein
MPPNKVAVLDVVDEATPLMIQIVPVLLRTTETTTTTTTTATTTAATYADADAANGERTTLVTPTTATRISVDYGASDRGDTNRNGSDHSATTGSNGHGKLDSNGHCHGKQPKQKEDDEEDKGFSVRRFSYQLSNLISSHTGTLCCGGSCCFRIGT